MSKKRNWFKTWAARIVLAVGGLLAVIVGVPMYMSATAAPCAESRGGVRGTGETSGTHTSEHQPAAVSPFSALAVSM